ncbi:hypothetical protein FRX31_021113 [Thalictrum thalictroides]|uniref:Uncharacterized protein n=1 Tax=Thalictrum thalictroides TaxID=46969 RepID=A0A7J6VW17_THATH|nr:hypothetical protein FRX31_021113 [Thalictrum thalictroides]
MDEDKENAKRLAIIALLCVEHNPRARPMLSNVVKMLEGKIKLDTPVAPFYPDYYSSESSSMSDSRDY